MIGELHYWGLFFYCNLTLSQASSNESCTKIWLIGLRQHQIAVVRQGPGDKHVVILHKHTLLRISMSFTEKYWECLHCLSGDECYKIHKKDFISFLLTCQRLHSIVLLLPSYLFSKPSSSVSHIAHACIFFPKDLVGWRLHMDRFFPKYLVGWRQCTSCQIS